MKTKNFLLPLFIAIMAFATGGKAKAKEEAKKKEREEKKALKQQK